MLVYAPSGYGKSVFASTAPKAFIASCELGHGGGALSYANTTEDWPKIVEPSNFNELEQFTMGNICPEAETLVIDGFSYAADSIIKDHALTISRSGGATRAMGIPDLSDYQTIAELERRLLARLLQQDKNVLVTCWQANYQPADGVKAERFGSADLPGAMRTGVPALFDVVLRMKIRTVLKNAKDPKSAVQERYWQTEGDGTYIAKSRIRNGREPVFPAEVPFNLETGVGTFGWFHEQAIKAHAKSKTQ